MRISRHLKPITLLIGAGFLLLIPVRLLAECPSKPYTLDRKKAQSLGGSAVIENVKIRVPRQQPAGQVGFHYTNVEDTKPILRDGVFTPLKCYPSYLSFPDYPKQESWSLVVPKLSSGRVSIYQECQMWSADAPITLTVKFIEGSDWVAALSKTDVPGLPMGEEQRLANSRSRQLSRIQPIPSDAAQTCEVDGELGRGIEVITYNQKPNAVWPQSPVSLLSQSELRTLGIRREFTIGDSYVEFAMIISVTPELSKEAGESLARQQMNLFMSGFEDTLDNVSPH